MQYTRYGSVLEAAPGSWVECHCDIENCTLKAAVLVGHCVPLTPQQALSDLQPRQQVLQAHSYSPWGQALYLQQQPDNLQ